MAPNWEARLPVWFPFSVLTKAVGQAATPPPVAATLKSWFASVGAEDELWTLVEQAIEDHRLLLLVDGLDEWADLGKARIALMQLKMFLEQNDAPAIVSSRPYGFEKLDMQRTGWKIAQLSGMSREQQRRFAELWLSHALRTSEVAQDQDGANTRANVVEEADRLMSELGRSPQLAHLAKVPLLLGILIILRLRHLKLPETRFRAYAAFVDELLTGHRAIVKCRV